MAQSLAVSNVRAALTKLAILTTQSHSREAAKQLEIPLNSDSAKTFIDDAEGVGYGRDLTVIMLARTALHQMDLVEEELKSAQLGLAVFANGVDSLSGHLQKQLSAMRQSHQPDERKAQ